MAPRPFDTSHHSFHIFWLSGKRRILQAHFISYLFLFSLRVSHFAKETWFLFVNMYIYSYIHIHKYVIHKYDNTHIFIIYITFLGIMMLTKAFLELYMYIYPSLWFWDGNIGLLFLIQWHFSFNFYHDQQQHPWSTCVQWQ